MPAASTGRPGEDRASRSVTRWSGRSGPAGPAVSVAIWGLLYQTKLISYTNPNDIFFPGQDATPGAAGRRKPPDRQPPGGNWPGRRVAGATATAAGSARTWPGLTYVDNGICWGPWPALRRRRMSLMPLPRRAV